MRRGDPAWLPGETLAGKYRIERLLGQGGMGVVLLARNTFLHERVAIKVVPRGAASASTSRLVMEARATARLKSDHVVRVFDAGETDSGDPYIVMEYLQGENLAELLQRSGPAPVADAVRWAREACEALSEAHAHGIIHRDVKPANLFLERRPDGSRRIKVLDFGIAKLPAAEALLETTHPIGSPIYMAPEQLAHDLEVDARVDIWGLGCVLYQLLTGRPPFDAQSLLDLAGKLRAGAYAPAAALCPALPPELSRIVDRCLASERTQRFPSALELGRALGPFGAAFGSRGAARVGSAALSDSELSFAGAGVSVASNERGWSTGCRLSFMLCLAALLGGPALFARQHTRDAGTEIEPAAAPASGSAPARERLAATPLGAALLASASANTDLSLAPSSPVAPARALQARGSSTARALRASEPPAARADEPVQPPPVPLDATSGASALPPRLSRAGGSAASGAASLPIDREPPW